VAGEFDWAVFVWGLERYVAPLLPQAVDAIRPDSKIPAHIISRFIVGRLYNVGGSSAKPISGTDFSL